MLQYWLPCLVVDDCRSTATVMQRMLYKIGFSDVTVRHSAIDAWVDLKQRRYGLLLVDIGMSPMTGLQLFESVRRNPRVYSIPVILTTAKPSLVTACVARSCFVGPTAFVMKPFAIADLRRKLAELLESPFPKEDLFPSRISKKYRDWAPSIRRGDLETTLLTRIKRVQFT